jgi:heme exporter protein C
MALTEQATLIEQERKSKSHQSVLPVPLASLLTGGLAFIGIMISIGMIFFYAPTDAVEGVAQRIFYIHVPIAWLGMLSFGVMALGGIGYLVKKDERWDWAARASAEIGTVFITLALITGSIWGKTTWGTWWSWEPKLTAVLIMWFMFVAYLMLRSYMGRTSSSASAGAVLGIVGVVDVPIIYMAATWWRSLHPSSVMGNLPISMLWTLLVALVSFTLLYCFLMIQIYQLEKLQTLAQRLRASVE